MNSDAVVSTAPRYIASLAHWALAGVPPHARIAGSAIGFQFTRAS
ncbi:MAG: hypothetical protein ACFCUJ_02490 [Thiotrichales bacterium]